MRFQSAIMALCAVLFAATHVQAQEGAAKRTVTVSASGTVAAEPDRAEITIGVVTQLASAKEAIGENSKIAERVLKAIREQGIEGKDIATDHFEVSPVYTRYKKSSGGATNRIEGFRVRNLARVQVRDIAKVGDVIDGAAQKGANHVGQIRFIISDLEARLDAARRDAMANAIRRARLYAEAAGASLGDVLTISESVQGLRPQPFEARARSSSMAASVPIEPGSQTLKVVIHVVWALQ